MIKSRFPIGILVNTGTTKNGGIHWQGLYIDHDHNAWFFDSFGRKPLPVYTQFASMLIIVSYLFDEWPKLDAKDILTTKYFTPTAVLRATQRTTLGTHKSLKWFQYQLQSAISDVCGEYALLFLYNMPNQREPSYSFWTDSDELFKIKTLGRRDKNNKEMASAADDEIGLALSEKEIEQLEQNDIYINELFKPFFNFRLAHIFDEKDDD